MSKVEFGVMLRQQKIDFGEIKEAAQLCDKLGYDSVWFYDHVLGQGIIGIDILEPWTLMSALSTVTERIKLGTMVLCNGFRHPPLLAKMAATLDYISSGRLEFALGAGWFEQEFTTYGYDYPDTVTRIEQLRESAQIIKSMWTEEESTFKGKHFNVNGAICNPKPLQKPFLPLTIGGSGEKYLLRVVAEHADVWNCPASGALEYDNKINALKNHCKDVGRNFENIRISQQTVCVLVNNESELEEKLEKGQRRYGFFGNVGELGIVGTPEQCIEKIKADVERGISKYTIFFSDVMKKETLELFANEVIPEFR